MINRTHKLRWRRRVKRSTHQAQEFSQQAEKGLDKHFFKRLDHIVGVRRFVLAWVFLLALLGGTVIAQTRGLSQFYQEPGPAPGGTYTEGVIGAFTNANPLYATGPVDATVSRLVFSGLMQYDSNNQLVGDIAYKLESNPQASIYTAYLREDAVWQDGRPLTAADVVFTYQTIQNPDAKSPLLPNWQNVKIEAKDEHTVVFTLPHGLASFPHTLVSGLVPKHLLEGVPPSSLRSSSFNTMNPVGSGPFAWEAVQVVGSTPETREEQVGLVRNDKYYLGQPQLDRFVVRAFRNDESLKQALQKREVTAAAGLDMEPPFAKNSPDMNAYDVPLMGEVMVFLRNTSPILSDVNVRQALTKATDTDAIIKGLGYPVIKADSLLLKRHIGYDPALVQSKFNPVEANQMLDTAGWTAKGSDGIRTKNGQKLQIQLYSKSNGQYAYVTSMLQKQWRDIGVKVDVLLQPDEELQSTIAFHNYDALLYGISLGNDPDIYAYWHSSQADASAAQRLNLAEYKSSTVDAGLEGGRSRVDPGLRAAKYRPMLEQWRKDAPAIALYQPRYLYITTQKVYGFNPTRFNTPVDRFANVQNWAIREQLVTVK
jgi:peptide/nickel transport system substrate-binding protein